MPKKRIPLVSSTHPKIYENMSVVMSHLKDCGYWIANSRPQLSQPRNKPGVYWLHVKPNRDEQDISCLVIADYNGVWAETIGDEPRDVRFAREVMACVMEN